MNQTQTGKKEFPHGRTLAVGLAVGIVLCAAGAWSLLGGAEAASMASAALGAAVLALTLVLALIAGPRSRRK